jgi:hypothetical protein
VPGVRHIPQDRLQDFDRYKEHGLEALSDRSRRPVRYANHLPGQVESLIVRLKSEKPHWGARKIRELLVRRLDGDVRLPAKSTIHAVLDRHGLVKRSGGPRPRARGTPLSDGGHPNQLWCADFKGEFKLGNGRYCYPLTVTDQASRFVLLCEALESTREDPLDRFCHGVIVGYITVQHGNAVCLFGGRTAAGSEHAKTGILQCFGCSISDAGGCAGHDGDRRIGLAHRDHFFLWLGVS